jgi:ABC-type amino acid transport substrate-binding protein
MTQDASTEGAKCAKDSLSYTKQDGSTEVLWNQGTYGGAQVAVYDENVRTNLRELKLTGKLRHGQEPLALPDMYWAGFFITDGRVKVSDMSAPFLDTGLKFAQKKLVETSFIESLLTFTLPFDGELWLTIMVLTFIVGIVFWFLECPEGDYMCEDFAFGGFDGQGWGRSWKGFCRTFTKSQHLAFGALSTAHNHVPVSSFGRIFSVVFTLFVLVAVTAYTANLASILISSEVFTPIETVAEIESMGWIQTVSSQHGTAYTNYLAATYPKLKICNSKGDGTANPDENDATCGQLVKTPLATNCPMKDSFVEETASGEWVNFANCGDNCVKASDVCVGDPTCISDSRCIWTPKEIKALSSANSLSPKLQEMAMRVLNDDCLVLVDIHTQAEYVTNLSPTDARPFCLLKNPSTFVKDEACHASPSFCEVLQTAEDKFWEQNLGVGVHKGLTEVTTKLAKGIIPLRSDGHFDGLDTKWFPESPCGALSFDVDVLGVEAFSSVYIMVTAIALLLISLELGLKHPVGYLKNKFYGPTIERMFHERTEEELENDMKTLFESYSGGDPLPWYLKVGGKVGIELSVSLGTVFVLVFFILGTQWKLWAGFQFGSGVLGGLIGALIGAIMGQLFGAIFALYAAFTESRKETVGQKIKQIIQTESMKASTKELLGDGDTDVIHLSRKELIRFALHETSWLSREQVFGRPNQDEMEIVWPDTPEEVVVTWDGKNLDLNATPRKRAKVRAHIMPEKYHEPDGDDDTGPMMIPVEECVGVVAKYPPTPVIEQNEARGEISKLGAKEVEVKKFISWWVETRNEYLSHHDPRTCVVGLLTAEVYAEGTGKEPTVKARENRNSSVSWKEFSLWYRTHHLDVKRG